MDPPSRVDATSGTGHGGQSELFFVVCSYRSTADEQ